ncbi:hypothetical protein PHMEG_00025975 [Phytophthora megakarya]|uniref:Ubiquitin-like protease family profile domain-containing protein n=1 Tax=Phytophthora megakarya TaxID=4795 RepID=A0A225VAQ2_9STRA|nr:hypothetical protein PHMEG_00025975 [Phytophthora megakarya]
MRLGLEVPSPRLAPQTPVSRRPSPAPSRSSAFSPIDVDGDSTDDAEPSPRTLDSDDSEKKSEPMDANGDDSPEEKKLNFFFNAEKRHMPETYRERSFIQGSSAGSSPDKDELHEVISAARASICGEMFDRCELEFGAVQVELTIWKGDERKWEGKIQYAHMVRFCFSRVDRPPYILLLQLDNSKGRSAFATFYDPIYAKVLKENGMRKSPKVYGVVFYFDDDVDYIRCQSMGDNNRKLAHLFKEKLSAEEVRDFSRIDGSTKSRYPLRSEPKDTASAGRSLTSTVMKGAKTAFGSVKSFFSTVPPSSVLVADESPTVVRSVRGRTLNLSSDSSPLEAGEDKTLISIEDASTDKKNNGQSAHSSSETVVLLQNTQLGPVNDAFTVNTSLQEEKTNENVENRKRVLARRREDEKLKRRKMEKRRNEVLVNYPYDGSDTSGRISVTLGDVDRLVPGEFLNDNIIDFYLRFLWRHLGPLDQQRMYFYTSYFFTQLNGTNGAHELATTDPDERFARVARWTQKETNLFGKQFLFIPINDSFHWSIAVFCNPGSAIIKKHRRVTRRDVYSTEKTEVVDLVDDGSSGEGAGGGNMGSGDGNVEVEVEEIELCQEDRLANPPCLLFLDSLRCHRKKKFTKMLRNYLECEWKARYGSSAVASVPNDNTTVSSNGIDVEDSIVTIFDAESIVLLEPNIPLQSNSSDCGVFLLMYAASIVRLFPAGVTREELEDNLTSRLTPGMFGDEHVREFREYLQQLIFCLQFLEKSGLPEEKVKEEELEFFTID